MGHGTACLGRYSVLETDHSAQRGIPVQVIDDLAVGLKALKPGDEE